MGTAKFTGGALVAQLTVADMLMAGPSGWVPPTPTPTPGPTPTPTPTVSLSAAQSQNEGNSGTTVFTYLVTRSTSVGAVSVPWTFSAGSTNASDFAGSLPTGGTVTIADGATTGTFTVTVQGDTAEEPNETFTVSITAPSGYALGTPSSATGTILNDDAAPSELTVVLTRLSAEGDSITFDQTANKKSYAYAWAAQNTGVTLTNHARSSAGIGQPGDANGVNSLYGRDQDITANAPQVITVLIGANDLPFASDANEWLTKLWAYIANLRSNNPGAAIGVAQVLPRGPLAITDAYSTSLEAKRIVANPVIRAAVGDKIDFLIPFGDNLSQTWMTDTFNSGDGLHFSNDGRVMSFRIYKATLDPIRDQTTGNNPSAFTLLDQNNVPLSGKATAQTIVTGLGIGKTAMASIIGGKIARGNVGAEVFGTTSFPVMNGDIVTVEVTMPATNDTAVNATLTIGSRSDTFTARTAITSPVTFVSSADSRVDMASAWNVPHNFTGVAFPAGRPVLGIEKSYNNAASVTINGVAAIKVGDGRVWVGPESQTLTAGNYDVVVTSPSNAGCAIFPAAVQGCTQTAASMAVSKIPLVANYEGSQLGDAELEVNSGGLMVNFVFYAKNIPVDHPGTTLERAYPEHNINNVQGASYARWLTSRKSGTPFVRQRGGGFLTFNAISFRK